MPSLFTELRRRNVFKVGAAYAIVAWLLIEVSSVLLPTFNAPEWIMQVFTLFVILGFPITLLMAWAYEITPEGLKTTLSVEREQSITPATGQRLNYVILGLVVLAVGFLVVDQYVLEPGATAPRGGSNSATTVSQRPLAERMIIDLGLTEMIAVTGTHAQIAISPDRRNLAYVIQRDGVKQLYVRPLDQLEARLLPGTESANLPFFSPSGEWIAYFSNQEIKRVRVSGGAPQVLTTTFGFYGSTWTTDNTIVFSSQDTTGGRRLYRIPATGSATKQELMISVSGETLEWPIVLPSGRHVVFTMSTAAGAVLTGRIAALSLETGEHEVLIDRGYNARYVPTGHLVFVRENDLWAVPFDPEEVETTGPEVRVQADIDVSVGINTRGTAAYTISEDGLLVYLPASGTADLQPSEFVWVTRDGAEQPTRLPTRPYGEFQISPDGQRVALTVTGENGNASIWVYDLEGGASIQLTYDDDYAPVWTPDGEHVVFGSRRDGGGIFWTAASGSGDVERLTSVAGSLQYPEGFPPDDQNRLIFHEFLGGIANLKVYLFDSEQTIPLVSTDVSESGAAISADGRWIAYEANASPVEALSSEIMVRPFPNVDGGGPWQVTTTGGRGPFWGPDGTLFYTGDNSLISEVILDLDPDGMTLQVVTQSRVVRPLSAIFNPDPRTKAITLDGSSFLLQKPVTQAAGGVPPQQSALVAVNNWFEELNRLAPPSP